eukprot:CAMPEP_0201872694 /NCGR_PEP_ID=MMETSP0902-20130614/5355_1 /ASSEMBLY_ACC=CAM_ASM_000551 /TAXON_ID=420261 /ORGANISM="Thalassiosira antarctica, Strain CCMP982" /LENGTH=36 /DNA_ID= /DNA_START= /DNA_END= /DNA_ORIENTATION=
MSNIVSATSPAPCAYSPARVYHQHISLRLKLWAFVA